MMSKSATDPSAMQEAERAFDLFGSRVRLLAAGPPTPDQSPQLALAEVEAMLREMHQRLTRFDPASELSALNADQSDKVECSEYLLTAVDAALRAAERSGGLIDPVMVESLEDAGYAESRANVASVPLAEALQAAPERSAASRRKSAPWRQITVDRRSAEITRPVGVRIDLGGIGKGLAADLAASHLDGFASWCADIGGDLRLGGTAGMDREIRISHPLGDSDLHLSLSQGAVATSGVSRRVWLSPDGKQSFHHLLDPATGLPAWTGVIQATAVAGSAQEAETLSKAALLSGPERGGEILSSCAGGLMILDSGEARVFGPLSDAFQAGADPSPEKVLSER
jgi:thiamine biosynthesis lipoprotein